ncbi:MAG: response regulator [Deltaproteobacteria bacterium]|nr:response regulator [Deltaproteobacteria bacterium]
MSAVPEADGASILLVEDDPLEAAIVTAILEKAGHRIVHHADPVAATKALDGERFDIVLCDYMMPRMNGLQVLRRARFHLPDSVRIIITSRSDFDIAVEAINQGEIYKFLRKPVDERELLVTVRLALERVQMQREVVRLTEALRLREAELAALNRS